MVVCEQRLSESAGVRPNTLFIREEEFSAGFFRDSAGSHHLCRHDFGCLDLILSASKSRFHKEIEEPPLVLHVRECFAVFDFI